MIPPPVGGGARSRGKSYVYLLKSRKDGKFYIGWTTSILRRLVEHQDGLSEFTQRTRPWQLIGFEAYDTAQAAKMRERSLKRNPRMQVLFKKRMLNRTASGGPRQVVG